VPTAVVTNQKAIGAGLASAADVDAVHARLRALLREAEPHAVLGPIFLADGTALSPQPKPAADLVRAALDALGAPPASALLVGDAATDAQAAGAAGVRFALVASSAHGEAAAAALAGGDALPCGARVGAAVWPTVGAAVAAELARLDRAAADAALERLARLSVAAARARLAGGGAAGER
jgi:beta-phosphoglucomutase-like phosphatase (HAD superfamily)